MQSLPPGLSEGNGGIVIIREAEGLCAVWGEFADGWRRGLAGGGGGRVEGRGDGLALIIDAGQERDGLLGAVDQAVAVRQQSDRLFVLGQRRRQVGLALLEVGDDPFELVEGT